MTTRYAKLVEQSVTAGGDVVVRLNKSMAGPQVLYYSVKLKVRHAEHAPAGISEIHPFPCATAEESEAAARAFFARAVRDVWSVVVLPFLVREEKTDWGRLELVRQVKTERGAAEPVAVYLVRAIGTTTASRHQFTERFELEADAVRRYESLRDPAVYCPVQSYQDRLEDARRLLRRESHGSLTFSLLMALTSLRPTKRGLGRPRDKEKEEPNFVAGSDGLRTTVIKILCAQQLLPPPLNRDAIDLFARRGAKALFSTAIRPDGSTDTDANLSVSTINQRRTLYIAMWSQLSLHPQVFGSNYRQVASVIAGICDAEIAARSSEGKILRIEHHKPLNAREIENIVLERVKSVPLRIHLLQILAFGFRATEAVEVDLDDIADDMLNYEDLNTKTASTRATALESAAVTLGLRILLRSKDEFDLGRLSHSDRTFLRQGVKVNGFTRRQLRTTAAKHLQFAASIQVLKVRLGHTTLDMGSRFYTKMAIPGLKNQSTVVHYQLKPDVGINVDGANLWDAEANDYDRFILTLVLEVFQAYLAGKPDKIEQFLGIVKEESNSARRSQASVTEVQRPSDFFRKVN